MKRFYKKPKYTGPPMFERLPEIRELNVTIVKEGKDEKEVQDVKKK